MQIPIFLDIFPQPHNFKPPDHLRAPKLNPSPINSLRQFQQPIINKLAKCIFRRMRGQNLAECGKSVADVIVLGGGQG